MSRFLRLIPLGAALCLATVAVAAPNVVGKYKGGIFVDWSRLPKPANQQQAQRQQMQKSMVEKTVVTLDIKSNHTYDSVVRMPMMKEPQKEHGTWKQQGSEITLTDSKSPGKPQTMTVAKDGKTITFVLPTQSGMSGKMVFKR